VIYYSSYYIFSSEICLFRWVIAVFITRILLLTGRSNIITIFIGWEGVGVISFVLIGWFISREKALSSSFYAFMFNRFADFFFLILLLWEISGQHRLFYLQFRRDFSFLNNNTSRVLIMVRLSFWIATAGKSAQFAFHPWLTLAIEGPTPVRRLLHRRTIVVAGVYLLLKLHPLIISSDWYLLNNVIILSRAVTMLFTSLWAINQVDIKKVIALSTTSQLRLIMVMCCINQYDLALLHIVLHGFFKALLFLGSGITIHNNSTNNQDVSKLNLSTEESSFLHTVFIIGVLGLIGAPFIGSFISKHLILESTQCIGSMSFCSRHFTHQWGYIRTLALIRLYLSPIITFGYSLKLLSFISQKPSLTILSSSYIRGSYNDIKVVVPISLLSTCRFVVGLTLRQALEGGKILSSPVSFDDILFSLFFLIAIIGLIYWILLPQYSVWFHYNISAFIVKSGLLHLHKFLVLCLFQVLEYLSFKKGLKSLIPTNNMRSEPRFSIFKVYSLKYCLSIYLYNLIFTIILINFLFAFFFLT